MYKRKTLVVNFFSGPGGGKSTIAALLFAKLKILGYNVELVTEYPKDKIWEESFKVMENQLYLFAKQQHRMWRLHDKVDIIVTDSPLLQYLAYSENMSDTFKMLVLEQSRNFLNFNVFLKRNDKKFQQVGRDRDLKQSQELDLKIIDLVEPYQVMHYVKTGNKSCDKIVRLLEEQECLKDLPV